MSEEGFGIRERIYYQRTCLASEKGRSTRESAALAPEKELGLREKVFNVIKKGSVSVRDQRKDRLDVRKGLVSEKGSSFSLVSEKGLSISPIALRQDAQAIRNTKKDEFGPPRIIKAFTSAASSEEPKVCSYWLYKNSLGGKFLYQEEQL